MTTANRRRGEQTLKDEQNTKADEDNRTISPKWTSMSPDPPNYPMIFVDTFVPVQFFPFGQEDNVLYSVTELRNLLLNSDLNQKSALFDDKKFWPDSQPKSRTNGRDDLRHVNAHPRQQNDLPKNHIGPTREVFQAWEVAPLWRGMNASLCLWVRDASEDFVRDCWKAHRSSRRQQYEEQGSQIFASADATNEELELITKYKIKYSRRDDTLLLALASIMCRSYRSVARLWKRIRCPTSNDSMDILSEIDRRASPQHMLEDYIVELEEMLISRHLKADPLDGGLQAHFDAFVEQAGQLNPLDPVEISRLTLAVQHTAQKELTYLKRRCRYLLDRRLSAEEALQPLEIAADSSGDNAAPDSVRPPRYIPIHRNIFTESAPEPDPEALYGCHCKDGVCSPLTCECVIEGGRTYSPDGSLSVNGVGHVVECNHKCLCNPETCKNRIIQKAELTVRSRYPLQIVKTAKCGFGVVSVLPIPAGQFICEYFGQIISETEAQRLQREVYFPLGLNYIWTDSFELPNGESAFSIDSTTHGNISRFVNHSCDPNLFSCRIERQYRDPRVPQVCFFTKRAIRAGEELTLDYNFDASKKEIECQCGKKKCRKWLR